MFLESTFIIYYEDYILFVYLLVITIHKIAAAIPRIVVKKIYK